MILFLLFFLTGWLVLKELVDFPLSIELLPSWAKASIAKISADPARDVFNEIVRLMTPHPARVHYKELLLIYCGFAEYPYAHAYCFLHVPRKDTKGRVVDQIVFLDHYLDEPKYYLPMNELEALNGGRFEVHKHIDGGDVVRWDLYCLKREEVEDEQERQRIGCRMMHMLPEEWLLSPPRQVRCPEEERSTGAEEEGAGGAPRGWHCWSAGDL